MLKLVENLGHRHGLALADTLTLDYEARTKGRLRAATDGGAEAGLFLERGRVLRHGDVLRAEDGTLVGVRSRAEAVVAARGADWPGFARACYHLGNRHVALQIGELVLRFKPDHVLEDLAQRLGLEISTEEAPFEPESGAYGGHSGHHQHDHGHGHDHHH